MIDKEQAAFGVRARAQPSRAPLGKLGPGQDIGTQEGRCQHVWRLLAADDRLQGLPHAENVLQLRLGAESSDTGKP